MAPENGLKRYERDQQQGTQLMEVCSVLQYNRCRYTTCNLGNATVVVGVVVQYYTPGAGTQRASKASVGQC